MASVARRAGAWAAALLGLYVLGVTPSLGQSLLESHAFRQTQTAYTAVLYAERGVDLLRPPLPILGPPGVIPLEFPLFQAIGAIVMAAGVQADAAMRLTGLACFVGAAAALFALARRLIGPTAALVALAAFLFNPLAWMYGRASLIEYLAAGGGVAYLLFVHRWNAAERSMDWLLALLCGVVSILVKITTGGFYLLPALLLRSRDGRWGFQRPSMWALIGLVVAAGFAWSAYAQGVRAETPASDFLALQNQAGWLFGTLEQRLDPGEWRVPLVAILMLTGSGVVLWAPLAVQRARQLTQAPFALAVLAIGAAMPLLLFNLYAVHDYYFAAVAPLVALAIGAGATRLAQVSNRRWARRAMVGLAGAWAATIIGVAGTWSLIYGPPAEEERVRAVADYIREHSDPDDWVVLEGWGWNPTFLYYARRQGISVPDHEGLQDTSRIDVRAIVEDPRMGPRIVCQDDRCALGN